jgi:PhnB protein
MSETLDAPTAQAQPETKGGPVPYLMPSDAAAASAFYQKAFAAQEVSRMLADDGKRLMHAHLYINGGSLMMSDSFPEHGHPAQTPAGFLIHLQVDDAELWWNRAVQAGATVTMPLETQFWGDRYGQLDDPFGFTWSIGQSKAA